MGRPAGAARRRVLVHVRAGAPGRDARGTAKALAADTLRPALPRTPGRGRGGARAGTTGCAAPAHARRHNRVGRRHPRTRRLRQQGHRRPGAAEVRRLSHVSPCRRRRRPRDGHHARDPLRRMDPLDAEASRRLPGARVGPSVLCARPRRSRPGRTQAQQAARRAQCSRLRRARLRAGGDRQRDGAARLVIGNRGRGVHPAGAGRAVHPGPDPRGPGRLRPQTS